MFCSFSIFHFGIACNFYMLYKNGFHFIICFQIFLQALGKCSFANYNTAHEEINKYTFQDVLLYVISHNLISNYCNFIIQRLCTTSSNLEHLEHNKFQEKSKKQWFTDVLFGSVCGHMCMTFHAAPALEDLELKIWCFVRFGKNLKYCKKNFIT